MTLSNPAQYISGRTVQEQMNSLIDYVDQRAADVALDAIAADVAQVHQDMLDADADAAAAAASAAAAAGTLANAVKKTGEASQSIAGDITVAGDLSAGGALSVTGAATLSGGATVPAPVNNTDAATKKYVDDQDALKISITDVNTYAIGLTGNQVAAGNKVFTSPIVGVLLLGFSESSGSKTAGTYQMMMKIPKTEITNAPVRSHLMIEVAIRGGASGIDVLDIAFNSKTPTSINMAWPKGLNHTVTYVVSDDTDNVYISRVNIGNSNDGVVCAVFGAIGMGLSGTFGTIDASERASAAVAGTETARVSNT